MFMLMFSHIKVGFVNDTDARLAPASVKLYSAVVNSAHWAKRLGHMSLISERSSNSTISLNKASREFLKPRLRA